MAFKEYGLEKYEDIDIDKAYEKARAILEEEMVDPKKFINFPSKDNIYSKDCIVKDINYVKRKEARFTEEESFEEGQAHKLAMILEAVLHKQAELSNWLGPNAFTIKTSRFDDIKNGIDTVVEFDKDNKDKIEHLGLAVDVTICPDINKKVERIKKEIEEGKLAEVKYFESSKTGLKKRLTNIPRVILSVDCGTVRELMQLWLDNEKEKLAQHPFQLQILEEILLQLESFREYAERNSQKEIVDIYEKFFEIVDKIYQDKLNSLNDSGLRDSAFNNLKNFLDNL